MSFVMLLVLTGIIVKVVLGGKKRAERRAPGRYRNGSGGKSQAPACRSATENHAGPSGAAFRFNTLAYGRLPNRNGAVHTLRKCEELIQYLRAALPQMRQGSTTLGKEVQLCARIWRF